MDVDLLWENRGSTIFHFWGESRKSLLTVDIFVIKCQKSSIEAQVIERSLFLCQFGFAKGEVSLGLRVSMKGNK
jgi:hypothetical protein